MSYTAPPSYTPPAESPGQPTPPRKRRWFASKWIIALGALLIGLFIGISAGSGSSAKTTTKTVAEPGPTVTATATVQAAAAAPVTQTVTAHPVIKKVVATHVQVHTVTYTPPPKAGFSDGTYLVGSDIKAGLYRTSGQGDGAGCYWERMKDFKGSMYSILDNGNIDGPTVVQVYSGDKAFQVSGGCTWRRS